MRNDPAPLRILRKELGEGSALAVPRAVGRPGAGARLPGPHRVSERPQGPGEHGSPGARLGRGGRVLGVAGLAAGSSARGAGRGDARSRRGRGSSAAGPPGAALGSRETGRGARPGLHGRRRRAGGRGRGRGLPPACKASGVGARPGVRARTAGPRPRTCAGREEGGDAGLAAAPRPRPRCVQPDPARLHRAAPRRRQPIAGAGGARRCAAGWRALTRARVHGLEGKGAGPRQTPSHLFQTCAAGSGGTDPRARPFPSSGVASTRRRSGPSTRQAEAPRAPAAPCPREGRGQASLQQPSAWGSVRLAPPPVKQGQLRPRRVWRGWREQPDAEAAGQPSASVPSPTSSKRAAASVCGEGSRSRSGPCEGGGPRLAA